MSCGRMVSLPAVARVRRQRYPTGFRFSGAHLSPAQSPPSMPVRYSATWAVSISMSPPGTKMARRFRQGVSGCSRRSTPLCG
jgi:hypothetical protein